MMANLFIALVVLWALCMCPVSSHAQQASDGWQPGLNELSAMSLLAGAQESLANLESGHSPFQRKIFLTSALASLSGLYQLHGAKWALDRLLPLYEDADCPDIHFGYSVDGRIRLTVEPLELYNPAFDSFTVLLVTLESNCGEHINALSSGQTEVELLDGRVLVPEKLSEEHVLWERLKRLADTFEPPPFIHPGGSTAFKQVYAVPKMASDEILAVSLVWDGYTIYVPYYENQADQQ